MHGIGNKGYLKPLNRQKGALTMFSAILILILLTEVIIYATQVGVFEQRKSSNDMRQKQAFHAAEAGIQHAKEYFLANVARLSYAGNTGWLEEGSERWKLCVDNDADLDPADPRHPCYGEALKDIPAVYDSTYFYSPVDAGITVPADDKLLPLYTDTLLELPVLNERVEVYALLCILDIDRAQDASVQPVVEGCTTTPGELQHIYFMLTLLARGQADCQDPTDPDTCTAEVLISERVGSYGPGAGDGGPGVPLTTRSNFPPSGTAELVPNPNGGGIGVPISAWINGNTTCEGPDAIADPSSGSWATCEAHEWYGVTAMPDEDSPNGKYACPGSTGSCECGQQERRISSTEGTDDILSMDIVLDPEFPCDLFKSFFKVDATPENFWKLAGSMGTVIETCDELGPESEGLIWMTGDTCTINANTVVGSWEFPVFLVSAAMNTTLNGGAELFGVLYVSDVLQSGAEFHSKGNNTIYGAAVVDATLGSYTGRFKIVYIDAIVGLASATGGLGEVSGGWTDAHRYWRFTRN